MVATPDPHRQVEERHLDERRDARSERGRPWLTARLQGELGFGIELFALCGVAITQPLLDVFGRSPEAFAFRGVDRTGAVVFALVVTLVPTAALWLGGALLGWWSGRLRWIVHALSGFVLLVVFVVQAGRSSVSGPVLVAVALVAAAGAVAAAVRFAPVRTWLRFMAVAPVVFLAGFLVWSPAARSFESPAAAALSRGVGQPAPVVMVVFDELPLDSLVDTDGSIDADLFPNFAALAERSSWYRNTTAVSTSTWYAVPALTTGQLQTDGPLPIAADHPESIFTLLGGDYDLEVTESVTRLCPTDLCEPADGRGGAPAVLGDAVDVLQSRLDLGGAEPDPVAGFVEQTAGAGATERAEGAAGAAGSGAQPTTADFALNQPTRITDFIDAITDARPALHYLHVLLPHVPYRYLPSGAQYPNVVPELGRAGDIWVGDPWLALQGRQRHLLQLGYVDSLLGKIIERMEAQDVFDDALLVVTADHGISFEPGGPIRGIESQTLGPATLADVAWVPLFVKEPGQLDARVSDRNALTIDVLPTIADVLDVDIPWAVDGRSLLGPARRSSTKTIRPSQSNPDRVEALDAVRVDGQASLDDVFARGVDTVLAPGGGNERWWRLGPFAELVGLDLDAARSEHTLTEVPAELVDPGAYDVEQGAAILPALVRATASSVAPGTPMAVEVNGVVAATAVTFPGDDAAGSQVTAMIDAARLRVGANQVKLYRIG